MSKQTDTRLKPQDNKNVSKRDATKATTITVQPKNNKQHVFTDADLANMSSSPITSARLEAFAASRRPAQHNDERDATCCGGWFRR